MKIAKEILGRVNYDKSKIKEILKIIEGHDSREEAISLDDKIVKDADKLWRFSKEGFKIDCKRFGYTPAERAKAKDMDINLLFTNSAKAIAREEIKNRLK